MTTLPDTPAGVALAALLAQKGNAYYDQFRAFHLALFSEHEALVAGVEAERAAAEVARAAAEAQVVLADAARQGAEDAAATTAAATTAALAPVVAEVHAARDDAQDAAAVAIAVAESISGGPVASVNGLPGPNVVLGAADVGALPADADVVSLATLHAYAFA